MRKPLLILMNTNGVINEKESPVVQERLLTDTVKNYLQQACTNFIQNIEINRVIWGKNDKAMICNTAANWNRHIYMAIAQGADPLVKNPETGENIRVTSNDSLIYQTLEAFFQTGVPFYPWADRFLFNMIVETDENNEVIDEGSLFGSIMKPLYLNHITTWPNDYAVIQLIIDVPEEITA